MNWAGVPLRSYDIMLNYIRSTTTRQGLKVDAILNEKEYEKGIKITDKQMDQINLKNMMFCHNGITPLLHKLIAKIPSYFFAAP